MLKYVSLYESFNESLKESDGIKNQFVPKTNKHIVRTLSSLLNIKKDSVVFVGGAGRGVNEDVYTNINVCLDKSVILKNNNIDESEIYDFIQSQLKRQQLVSESVEEEDRLLISWPIEGSPKKGIIEVCLQLSEATSWIKFAKHSPNLNEGESKYSGKYRQSLLKAIVESIKQEISAYYDDKDVVKEYVEYRFDQYKGLFNVTKTFEGKNGVLSRPVVLENSKKLVTNNPDQFIKVCFGESAESKDFDTFEKCWEAFEKSKFLQKKKKKITEKFKRNLIGLRLTIPENLL